MRGPRLITNIGKQMDRLFFTALFDVVKPRSAKDGSVAEAQRLERIPDRKGLLAEALLFSDQVVIDLQGPNVQLSLLYHLFGYEALCDLLEQEVIHFSFCPGYVSYFSRLDEDRESVTGRPVLQRITVKDPSWSDPFESAAYALREQTDLSEEERHFLAQLATRNTRTLPADRVFGEAIRLAKVDRLSPLGQELGLPPNMDPHGLIFGEKERRTYLDLAHHNLAYLGMVLSDCSDIVAEQLAYRVMENRVTVNSKIKDCIQVTNQILQFENTANVRDMVAKGTLPLDAVLEIRKSRHLREFRDWLKNIRSQSSDIEVLKAYNSAVNEKLSGELPYKLLKIGVFTCLGALVGSPAGPLGAGLGALASNLLLNFTDTFFIDKLVDGWNPKIFIEKDIKSRVID